MLAGVVSMNVRVESRSSDAVSVTVAVRVEHHGRKHPSARLGLVLLGRFALRCQSAVAGCQPGRILPRRTRASARCPALSASRSRLLGRRGFHRQSLTAGLESYLKGLVVLEPTLRCPFKLFYFSEYLILGSQLLRLLECQHPAFRACFEREQRPQLLLQCGYLRFVFELERRLRGVFLEHLPALRGLLHLRCKFRGLLVL
mmetsp:Transcript_4644/g.10422  ORF Transcript_4644/g.10422 Transcript_4644/m.10422 type:complete len:201 (-) Transcript_4644:868-1470(-)